MVKLNLNEFNLNLLYLKVLKYRLLNKGFVYDHMLTILPQDSFYVLNQITYYYSLRKLLLIYNSP